MTTVMEPERDIGIKAATYLDPSRLLDHLPAIYHDDDFMGRFLRIFEDILGPIEHMIDNMNLHFDPMMAPDQFLPWLASWVDLALDQRWPVDKRRELIRSAVQLYQWRGTRRGLREYLRIYTGGDPVITEHFGGIRLGEESRLGWNTVMGDGLDHCITVTLEVEDPSLIDADRVKAIIEVEKPAHVAYRLNIVSDGNLDFLVNDED